MFGRLVQLVKKHRPISNWKYQELDRRVAELQAELQEAISQNRQSMIEQRLTVNYKLACHVPLISQLVPEKFAVSSLPSLMPRTDAPSFEECLAKLEAICPNAYAMWRRLLDVNGTAYEGFPPDSCSVAGHPLADDFRRFLSLYLRGVVLDIGCGPQPVPLYLRGHPLQQIAGIDPLLPPQPHPFVFRRGVSEYLPWNDQTFDVVIASTSLDHVLLLDHTFAEIHRVLKPSGRFVTWVSFIPGSPKYEPFHPDLRPVDAFHLFHFDSPWFFEEVKPYFDQEERVDLPGSSFVSLIKHSKGSV